MNLPFKVNEREKRFLVIGGLVVLAILLFHSYSWYTDFRKRADDFSDAKRITLEKQLKKMSEKGTLEKESGELRQELEKQEKALLQGNKPTIAAAALSRILRDNASASGFNIALERTLNPEDFNNYVAVPVEIGFTTTTEKLKELLFKLRVAPYLFNISDVKVRVINITNPVDVYTSLVVTGYIKKTVEKEKETVEVKEPQRNTEAQATPEEQEAQE